jgi:uncharacterized damage-inducible protein DinB
MNIPEFFVQRWEAEQPAFSKVLRALPDGPLTYKPHERSTSAGDLAWQLAEEQRVLSEMIDTGVARWEARPTPATVAEIVSAWDAATATLRERLKSVDEAKAAGKAEFLMGGQSVWTDTVGGMLWGFLFDMVHHRGQLSTYLRPMGGKVPSIYGPSADDNGGA